MFEVPQEMMSEDLSKIFSGVNFVLYGFDFTSQVKIRHRLVEGGGLGVDQYGPDCTHVIVDKIIYDDPICNAARCDGKTLVTGLWVEHSFDAGMPVDPTSIMYTPLRDLNGIPGARSLVICLTGYLRQERDDIMTMVGLMGAIFSKPLVANKVTHLVCYKFEGDKYELAKKMKKIKLVNHRWLEDSLRAWELLPEADYDKSGYELELLEAQAKDSEDEAENMDKMQPSEKNILVTPQSSRFKSRSPAQLFTQKERTPTNAFNSNLPGGSGNFSSSYGVNDANANSIQLKEVDNKCPDMPVPIDSEIVRKICSSESELISKSPLNELIGKDKFTPAPSSPNFQSVTNSRQGLHKSSLTLESGQLESNSESHMEIDIGKNRVGHEFDLSSMEAEGEVTIVIDGRSSSIKARSPNGGEQHSVTPVKKSFDDSCGSFEFVKKSESPGFISKGALGTTSSEVSLAKSLVEGQTMVSPSKFMNFASPSKLQSPREPENLQKRSVSPNKFMNFASSSKQLQSPCEPENLQKRSVSPNKFMNSASPSKLQSPCEPENLQKRSVSPNKFMNSASPSKLQSPLEPENLQKRSVSPNMFMNSASPSKLQSPREPQNLQKSSEKVLKNKSSAILKSANVGGKILRAVDGLRLPEGPFMKPKNRQQDEDVPSPNNEGVGVKDLNAKPDIDLVTEEVNSGSKPKQRKLLAKKTLGSRPSLGRGKALNKKGSIYMMEKDPVINNATTSLGNMDVENNQDFGKFDNFAEVTSTSAAEKDLNTDIEKFDISGNEAPLEMGEKDDETVSPRNNDKNETYNTVSKGNSDKNSTLLADSTEMKTPSGKEKCSIEPRKMHFTPTIKGTSSGKGASKKASKRKINTGETETKIKKRVPLAERGKKLDSSGKTSEQNNNMHSNLEDQTMSSADEEIVIIEAGSVASGSKTELKDSTSAKTENRKRVSVVKRNKKLDLIKTSEKNDDTCSKLKDQVMASADEEIVTEAVSVSSGNKMDLKDSTSAETKNRKRVTVAKKDKKLDSKNKNDQNDNSRSKSDDQMVSADEEPVIEGGTVASANKIELKDSTFAENASETKIKNDSPMQNMQTGPKKATKRKSSDAQQETKNKKKVQHAKRDKKSSDLGQSSLQAEKENLPVSVGDQSVNLSNHQSEKLTQNSNKKSTKKSVTGDQSVVSSPSNPNSSKKSRKSVTGDHSVVSLPLNPNHSLEPAWFILSGHRLQRKEFQKVIKHLKGRLCRDTHQWSYQATHFIVPDPVRRTEKFFAAAASGRWILKTDYLTASNEAGKFLPEEPFEWHKTGLSEDGAINLEAPRKWRTLRGKTGHGAFYGMRVVIYGDCIAPPLETLKRVIKSGDGIILATSPPYTRFLESGVDYAIVSPGMPRVDICVQEFLKHEVPCILADYLVDYVCKPGYSLDKHVQYNTQAWAEKSFNKLADNMDKIVDDWMNLEVVNNSNRDNDIACQVCGSCERGDVMLICGDEKGSSGCGVGTHIDCCDPPLDEVPEEDWFCVNCRTISSSSSSKKRDKSKKRTRK